MPLPLPQSPLSVNGIFAGSFPDNIFTIVDDGDITKKIAFQASGITTANNKELASLVRGWTSGRYDEDPEYLLNELLWLVK